MTRHPVDGAQREQFEAKHEQARDPNLVDCIDRQHRQPEKGARVKDLQGFGKASLVESVRFAQMEKFIQVDGPIEHEFELQEQGDRKSTRLNSSHLCASRMLSSA